jgi:AhpD family alkylhydroperoxidase
MPSHPLVAAGQQRDPTTKETSMQDTATIEPRMSHIATLVPEAAQALYALAKSAKRGGLPETTAVLVHLRASQINGCSFCAEMHSRELEEAGEPAERIWTVGAWREAPYFTDAERAALELTEAVTRLSDRADPVPDDVWEEVSRHYDDQALASLLIETASINVWNRFNVAIRMPAGSWPQH